MRFTTHVTEFEHPIPDPQPQLDKALQLYEAVVRQRHGKVIFIAGEVGTGKSEVLSALAETFSSINPKPSVIFGKFNNGKYIPLLPKVRTSSGDGMDATGNSLAMLAKVIGLKTGLPIDVIFNGMDFLLDFVGQTLQTSVSLQNAFAEVCENPPDLADLPDWLKKLLRQLAEENPVICLLDDFEEAQRFEWIAFLNSFAEEMAADLPLLFFVSVKGAAEIREHDESQSELEYVIWRLVKGGLAEWWHLNPVTREQIATWIDLKTEPGIVEQLHGVTGGSARWVRELWRSWKLREAVVFNEHRQRWEWSAENKPPLNLFDDALRDHLKSLLHTEELSRINHVRQMLACAALEGTTFTADALAIALGYDVDELIDFLDDVLLQNEEKPDGILREEQFLTLEVPQKRALRRYSFISDWHWQVIDRYALTKGEKKQKSADMLKALLVTYEGEEQHTASAVARLFRFLGYKEEAKQYQIMADYTATRESKHKLALRFITLKTDDMDARQCSHAAMFLLQMAKEMKKHPAQDRIDIFDAATHLAVRGQVKRVQAEALHNSGFNNFAIGQFSIAQNKALDAHHLFKQIRDRDGESVSLTLLVQVVVKANKFETEQGVRPGIMADFAINHGTSTITFGYEDGVQTIVGRTHPEVRHAIATGLNSLASVAFENHRIEEAISLRSISNTIYAAIGSQDDAEKTLGKLRSEATNAEYTGRAIQELIEKAATEYKQDEAGRWTTELLEKLFRITESPDWSLS